MKIGLVTWRLDYSGGTERHVIELAVALQALGHDVRLYAAYCDRERCYPERLQLVRSVTALGGAWPYGRGVWGRVRGYWRNLRLRARLAALIDRDLDCLCCEEYLVFPVGIRYRARTGVPVIGVLHDAPAYCGVQTWRADPARFVVTWGKRRLFGPAMHALDRLVVISRMVQEQVSRFFGIDRAVVIHNGLNLEQYPYRPPAPIDGRPLSILTIGSFFPWRRYEDVVAALALLRDRGVVMAWHHVGTEAQHPHYAAAIRQAVAAANLTAQVTWHGAVSDAELVRCLQAADVFVFPHHPQTWGLIVFEAMAVGLPVVATATCGAADLLTDDVNALLVAPGHPELIAERLHRLWHDPALRERCSRAGRALVESRVSWTRSADALVRLCGELVSRPRAVA